MKQFTMSMFATKESLLRAKCKYFEDLIVEHRKIFEWVANNPGCHPENVRSELRRLLEELEDENF